MVKLQPSRGTFSIFALLHSAVTAPIFINISHDVEVLVQQLICHLQNYVALCFEMTEQRVKTVNFDVCKKAPKLMVAIATFHQLLQNYFSFIICIHNPTKSEKLVKFGPVLADIFGMICRFLPSRFKRYSNSLHNLWG